MKRFTLALVLLAFTGCGRAEDERAASAVTERFLIAVEAGDGETACAQLSPDTAEALEATRACDEAVTDLDVSTGAVTHAAVFSTGAKVDVRGGQSFFLERTRAGWRISAAGCEPTTRDEPFDCEARA